MSRVSPEKQAQPKLFKETKKSINNGIFLETFCVFVIRQLLKTGKTADVPSKPNQDEEVLFGWLSSFFKVYESPYIAYFATSGSKREMTKQPACALCQIVAQSEIC